jgi:hypothetical protein
MKPHVFFVKANPSGSEDSDGEPARNAGQNKTQAMICQMTKQKKVRKYLGK